MVILCEFYHKVRTVFHLLQIMAHISKAHLNPAVTFSLVVIGDLNLPLAGVYIVSQVIGATLGYGVLMVSQSTSIQGTQNAIYSFRL
jgi:glycerol uptake facilitator-like aquaporin